MSRILSNGPKSREWTWSRLIRSRFVTEERLPEIRRRGRWRSEKSVRRNERHVRLLEKISKLSDVTRKYGQLVMSRISRLLSDALSPPPYVLAKLIRNHAWSQKLVVASSCTVFSNILSVKAETVDFFLLLDVSDQLVGGQVAYLSSLGVMILSEVLSSGFGLSSLSCAMDCETGLLVTT